MKKIIISLGSIGAATMPILVSVSFSNKTSINNDVGLTELEKRMVKGSDIYKKLINSKRQISQKNIDHFSNIVDNSFFSSKVKKVLNNNLKSQVSVNKLVNNHIQSKQIQSNTIIKSRSINNIPIQRHDAIATAGKPIDFNGAFLSSNYISQKPLVGPGGHQISYNGIDLQISGEDITHRDYHMFNPDTTIINVSNSSILNKIKKELSNTKEYRDFQTAGENLKQFLEDNKTNIDIVQDLAKVKIELFQNAFKNLVKINKWNKMLPFLKKLNYAMATIDFFNTLDNYINKNPHYDAIDALNHSIVSSAASTIVGIAAGFTTKVAIGAATGAAAGPPGIIAGTVVGTVVGIISDVILNVIPTPNGYSISDNIGDHGINDFKFQWKHNSEVMTQIELEFSENLTHGISWKVEDSLLDTPNLWIRSGQIATQPWIKLSEDVLTKTYSIKNPVTGKTETKYTNKKLFVWGEPIRFKSYNGVTSIKKWLDTLTPSSSNTIAYKDTLEVSMIDKIELNNGGVEYSGRNKHYDMTLNYKPHKYNDSPISMEPPANVHENDHDDNNAVKYRDWKPKFSNDGSELKKEDIENGNLGNFSIYFDDGNRRYFPQLDDQIKIAAKKAIEYADFVLAHGSHPKMIYKNNGTVSINDKEFQDFYQDKTYVPRFYLSYVKFGEIKFNTYNDKGWDDTHSDYFRFYDIKIGIFVKFLEF